MCQGRLSPPPLWQPPHWSYSIPQVTFPAQSFGATWAVALCTAFNS